jgi:hypothetical protein
MLLSRRLYAKHIFLFLQRNADSFLAWSHGPKDHRDRMQNIPSFGTKRRNTFSTCNTYPRAPFPPILFGPGLLLRLYHFHPLFVNSCLLSTAHPTITTSFEADSAQNVLRRQSGESQLIGRIAKRFSLSDLPGKPSPNRKHGASLSSAPRISSSRKWTTILMLLPSCSWPSSPPGGD